jgi:RNA polymerase sigma-70 factor (ECF subfamily)
MSIATLPVHSGEILTQELERIFREHYQFVYRTAYSVTANYSDAEDVVQTVFLKLFQREAPLHLRKEPRAYLYRAAVNAALNVVRSRKHHSAIDERESSDVAAPDFPADADQSAIQRNLMGAIAQLNPKAIEILVLRYGHDFSDAQIAKMLGKSRGTIAVTLYRARARLKKLMRVGEGL